MTEETKLKADTIVFRKPVESMVEIKDGKLRIKNLTIGTAQIANQLAEHVEALARRIEALKSAKRDSE